MKDEHHLGLAICGFQIQPSARFNDGDRHLVITHPNFPTISISVPAKANHLTASEMLTDFVGVVAKQAALAAELRAKREAGIVLAREHDIQDPELR